MRRAAVIATLGALGFLPAAASAGSLELRLGGFLPRADSNLFDDDAELFTRHPGSLGSDGRPVGLRDSDWRGFSGGLEYSVRLARNLEMGFHVDGYERSLRTSYRDRTRQDDSEIRQTLKLTIVPVGVSFRLVPTGRHARLAPYATVGADLFFWRYEEYGDFVDFLDPAEPILSDAFVSDGVTPGFHVAGGLRVPLNHDLSITAEVRYQVAKETNMGDDFVPNAPGLEHQLDLTGASATIGINLRF